MSETEKLIERLRDRHEMPGLWQTRALFDEAADALTRLREENARLSAEIERKNAALEPFAKMAKLIDGPFGPRSRTPDEGTFQSGGAWTENGKPRTLTWGDFRRARAALTQEPTEPTELASEPVAVRERNVRTMSDEELAAEDAELARKWQAYRDPDFDGHSGSPGEWIVERSEEIAVEQKRRAAIRALASEKEGACKPMLAPAPAEAEKGETE